MASLASPLSHVSASKKGTYATPSLKGTRSVQMHLRGVCVCVCGLGLGLRVPCKCVAVVCCVCGGVGEGGSVD